MTPERPSGTCTTCGSPMTETYEQAEGDGLATAVESHVVKCTNEDCPTNGD